MCFVCFSARVRIARILHSCTVDNSERYVKSSLVFSAVYAKGEDCHGTESPYPGKYVSLLLT